MTTASGSADSAWDLREPGGDARVSVEEPGAGGYDEHGDPEDLPAMVFRPGWPE